MTAAVKDVCCARAFREKVYPNPEVTSVLMDDAEAFRFGSWANIVGNLVKIVLEGAVGFWFGSLALVADAAHSLGDLFASGVVLVVGGWAFKDGDDDHPHGHHRFEPVASLVVAGVLFVLAAKLIHDAHGALVKGPEISFDPVLVAVLGVAIGIKLATYWATVRLNDGVGSTGLDALAVDCLNDVYASVAAVVGVVGAAAGYPVFDPIAGGVMAAVIAWQAGGIARENVGYLVGEAASEEKRNEIRSMVVSHTAVHGVHDMKVFYVGPVLEVEFHAEVDGNLALREAHEVETELMKLVRNVEDVEDAHVHLDPSGMGEWENSPE